MDRRQEIQKQIEELQSQLEMLDKPYWVPTEGEQYYMIENDGTVKSVVWHDDYMHRWNIMSSNYFKTKEDVAEYNKNKVTKYELQRLAKKLNNGIEPDWNNNSQAKFYLYMDRDKLRGDFVKFNQHQGTIYCTNKNFYEQALETIGEERIIKMIRSGM